MYHWSRIEPLTWTVQYLCNSCIHYFLYGDSNQRIGGFLASSFRERKLYHILFISFTANTFCLRLLHVRPKMNAKSSMSGSIHSMYAWHFYYFGGNMLSTTLAFYKFEDIQCISISEIIKEAPCVVYLRQSRVSLDLTPLPMLVCIQGNHRCRLHHVYPTHAQWWQAWPRV